MSTPPLVASSSQQSNPAAYIFFDGQNLFHDAQREFGSSIPDFCPHKLANLVCRKMNWDIRHIRFYTGVPTEKQNRKLAVFWSNKSAAMKRLGIVFESRKLSERTTPIRLYDKIKTILLDGSIYPGRFLFDNAKEIPDGVILEATTLAEKGIDVRIAVDAIRFALRTATRFALSSQETRISRKRLKR